MTEKTELTYAQKYYQDNKERLKEYKRQYYLAHKEEYAKRAIANAKSKGTKGKKGTGKVVSKSVRAMSGKKSGNSVARNTGKNSGKKSVSNKPGNSAMRNVSRKSAPKGPKSESVGATE